MNYNAPLAQWIAAQVYEAWDLGSTPRGGTIKGEEMSIPNEVWVLDNRWRYLGEDISRLRHKFMGATNKDSLVEFGKEALGLRAEFKELLDESLSYLRQQLEKEKECL